MHRREDERRLRRMQKELERLAHTDALTGLYNRRIFMHRLEEEVERVRRHGSALSVLLFDLDFFKRVNDTYGHDTGDVVLAAIARIATEVKRVSDVAARLGGEEFALCCPDADLSGAMKVAERIRQFCEDLELYADHQTFGLTVILGVTLVRANETIYNALKRADGLLYQAKQQGRNRCISEV